MPPFHWLMAQLMLFVSAILVGRLLWWSPVIMSAGGTANLIELQWRGAVLDWIIIPMGPIIKAISLGDVAIFVGAAWCAVAVVAICIRGFHEPSVIKTLRCPPKDTLLIRLFGRPLKNYPIT